MSGNEFNLFAENAQIPGHNINNNYNINIRKQQFNLFDNDNGSNNQINQRKQNLRNSLIDFKRQGENNNFNINNTGNNKNALNPKTIVNKNHNLLETGININLQPKEDSKNNNNESKDNNMININNNRRTYSFKNKYSNVNNINNLNLEQNKINLINDEINNNINNIINNNTQIYNNKNRKNNFNNNNQGINNQKNNIIFNDNRINQDILDNNYINNNQRNKNKNNNIDNNIIQINNDHNNKEININLNKKGQNGKNLFNNNQNNIIQNNNKKQNINIHININQNNEDHNSNKSKTQIINSKKNRIHNNNNLNMNPVNNEQNYNKIIEINNRQQNLMEKCDLFQSVICFGENKKSNNINRENRINQRKKEELLKKKKQDERNKAEIKDKLKCYICMDRLKKPRICKFCNRPSCEYCLKNWLKTKDQCGFCRKKISFEDTIEIPIINDIAEFFMKNIENAENSSENDNSNQIYGSYMSFISSNFEGDEDICPKHKKKYEHFCFQCNEKYCDKCLSFLDDSFKIHEKHNIIPLEQMEKNKTVANDIVEELKKMKQSNLEIDNLINQCNMKIEELEIQKNNFMKQIDFISNEIKTDLDQTLFKINKEYDKIKSKTVEIDNTIDTTPKALKNIIYSKDHGQGKKIYEHITDLNKFDLERNALNSFNSLKNKLYIETYISENMEIIVPDNKSNNFKDNQTIIKEQSCNLIPDIDMKIFFEYSLNNVCLSIKLKNKNNNNIDLSKILCFVIFMKKTNSCEFNKLEQKKENNEIKLTTNISSYVFNSFKDEKNMIIYKLNFLVYKS